MVSSRSRTSIGRATLYKYFSDVDLIPRAWHEREISRHLAHVAQIRDHAADACQRFEAALNAYALITRQTPRHHETELVAFLHQDEHLADAQAQLDGLVTLLLADAATNGQLREDVAPDELATYCLHALGAASSLHSEGAVRRLVKVTLAGLRRSC